MKQNSKKSNVSKREKIKMNQFVLTLFLVVIALFFLINTVSAYYSVPYDLSIDKIGNVTEAEIGDAINFTFYVKNWKFPDKGVHVGDSLCDPVYIGGDKNGNKFIEPGETWVFKCIYIVDNNDVVFGWLNNTATVYSNHYSKDLNKTNNTDSWSIKILEIAVNPDINVTKEVSTDNSTWLKSISVLQGTKVYWKVVVANIGDVLLNVTLTDRSINENFILNPGESKEFYYTTIPASDGTNIAFVEGEDENGNKVYDSDIASVNVINPDITITKSPNYQRILNGSDASFKINVTNTGDVDLFNVTVSDALAPNCSKFIGNLSVGESYEYECSIGDVKDDFTNNAYAKGEDKNGNKVRDNDTAYVDVIKLGINVIKNVSIDNSSWVDHVIITKSDKVYWKVVVKNTGNTDLLVTLTDDNGLNESFNLLVGESKTFYYNTTPSHDINNIATATGYNDTRSVKDSDDASVSVRETQICSIVDLGVKKFANLAKANIGDTIKYTINVTNYLGNATGITVVDSLCNLNGPNKFGDSDDILEVGEIWQYTCNYTITANQTGWINNTVYVYTNDSIDINVINNIARFSVFVNKTYPSCQECPLVDLVINKRALNASTMKEISEASVGDEILYVINVTNYGQTNISGSDFIVVDSNCELSTADDDGWLNVSETWTYTCNYIVASDDGKWINNTAFIINKIGDFDISNNIDKASVKIIDYGECGCKCEGGVRKIKLRYDGSQNGVTIKVYNSKDIKEGNLIITFTNVSSGDELFVDGSNLKNGKFKADITWVVEETGEQTRVHVSCSQPLIIGSMYGNFTLLGYEDVRGNRCGDINSNYPTSGETAWAIPNEGFHNFDFGWGGWFNYSCDVKMDVPLIAGQQTEVGTLNINYTSGTLSVTYNTKTDYCLSSTHLYVSDREIPPTNAPGQFPYKHENLGCMKTDVFNIQMSCEDILYVSAHTDVS